MKISLTILLWVLLLPLWGAELNIFCTADLHGRADNLAKLAPALRPGGENALRIDVGDTVQGTLLSQFSDGKIIMESLNALNFDLWIPGNHDFEFGFDRFNELAKHFRGVVLGGDWRWHDLTGTPWQLIHKNGVKAAVIGLTDPAMPNRVLPGSGESFTDPETMLAKIMPGIRAQNPDVVILCWHNGLYSSIGSIEVFLRRFPEIDLVIGAHSHEEHPGESAGRAFFLQAGEKAHSAGKIRIIIDDRTRKILKIESGLVRPGKTPDAEVLHAQQPFRAGFEEYQAELIAFFPQKIIIPNKIINDHPLARLAAQAYQYAAGSQAAYAAITLPPAQTIDKLDRAKLFKLFPYESQLCTIELGVEELQRFTEEQAKLAKRRNYLTSFVGIPAEFLRGQELQPANKLTLTVTDFTLSSSKVLRPLLDDPKTKWLRLPIGERECLTRFFNKRQANGLKFNKLTEVIPKLRSDSI